MLSLGKHHTLCQYVCQAKNLLSNQVLLQLAAGVKKQMIIQTIIRILQNMELLVTVKNVQLQVVEELENKPNIISEWPCIHTHNLINLLGYGPVIYTPCRLPFHHKGQVFQKCIFDLPTPSSIKGIKRPKCKKLIKAKRKRNAEVEKQGKTSEELLREPFKRFFFF